MARCVNCVCADCDAGITDEEITAKWCAAVDRAVKQAKKAAAEPFDFEQLLPASVKEAA
jgi:hypothetical protein